MGTPEPVQELHGQRDAGGLVSRRDDPHPVAAQFLAGAGRLPHVVQQHREHQHDPRRFR
jgi:hypothetical protein